MKRILLSVAVALGLATVLPAQTLKVRGEVGGNVASFTETALKEAVENRFRLGIRANLGLEYRLSGGGLYAYGTLGYRNNSVNRKVSLLETGTDLKYLTLGTGLGYRIGLSNVLSLALEGGLVGGYALEGKTGLLVDGKLNLSQDVFKTESGYKRPELAWGASLALSLSRLYLRAGVEYGLTNVYEVKLSESLSHSLKNRSLYLALGLYF